MQVHLEPQVNYSFHFFYTQFTTRLHCTELRHSTRSLPHLKSESEGAAFPLYAKTNHLPPPSLQTRDGEVNHSFLFGNNTTTPSLAPSARRRGVPSFFIGKRHDQPPSRSKCELEGYYHSFLFGNNPSLAPSASRRGL